MALPIQKDSVELGLSRLLNQFQGKEVIENFLTSYLSQIDITQDDTFTILNNNSVFTAQDAFLDNIGRLVNVSRAGSDDEEYRDRILDQILVNTSEGTPKDVLNALKEITGATTVRMFEHYPCNLHLYTDGSENLDTVADTIASAVPATVSDVTIVVDDVGGVFTPSELTSFVTDAGPMVTGVGDSIVTDQGDTILLRSIQSTSDTSLAILPELGSLGQFQVDNGTGLDDFQVNDGSGLDNFFVNDAGSPDGFVPMAEIRRKS